MSEIELSVIIPAYNEAGRIGPTLEKISSYLAAQPYTWEVLVVDDGSTDKTCDVVDGFSSKDKRIKLLRNHGNMGKGASVRAGMISAAGAYRLFSDADLSTPIEEVAKFLPLMKQYPVVIGSRRVKGAKLIKRQPVLRELSGRIFSLLVRWITLPGFLDTQCGFKMFTKEAAQKIFLGQKIKGFGFDVEVLYIAQEVLGYKVLETPVTWLDSSPTKVHFFRDSTRMFKDLFFIRKVHSKQK